MGNEPLEMEQTMTSSNHDIVLSADRSGNIITITCIGGNPGPSLKRGSPAHRFRFTLQDNTGLNVKFASLDTEDNCPNCPPPGGDNSRKTEVLLIPELAKRARYPGSEMTSPAG